MSNRIKNELSFQECRLEAAESVENELKERKQKLLDSTIDISDRELANIDRRLNDVVRSKSDTIKKIEALKNELVAINRTITFLEEINEPKCERKIYTKMKNF